MNKFFLVYLSCVICLFSPRSHAVDDSTFLIRPNYTPVFVYPPQFLLGVGQLYQSRSQTDSQFRPGDHWTWWPANSSIKQTLGVGNVCPNNYFALITYGITDSSHGSDAGSAARNLSGSIVFCLTNASDPNPSYMAYGHVVNLTNTGPNANVYINFTIECVLCPYNTLGDPTSGYNCPVSTQNCDNGSYVGQPGAIVFPYH